MHPDNCHNNADAMSRIPCKHGGKIPAEEAVVLNAVTTMNFALLISYSLQDFRNAQLEDISISLLLIFKESKR